MGIVKLGPNKLPSRLPVCVDYIDMSPRSLKSKVAIRAATCHESPNVISLGSLTPPAGLGTAIISRDRLWRHPESFETCPRQLFKPSDSSSASP